MEHSSRSLMLKREGSSYGAYLSYVPNTNACKIPIKTAHINRIADLNFEIVRLCQRLTDHPNWSGLQGPRADNNRRPEAYQNNCRKISRVSLSYCKKKVTGQRQFFHKKTQRKIARMSNRIMPSK